MLRDVWLSVDVLKVTKTKKFTIIFYVTYVLRLHWYWRCIFNCWSLKFGCLSVGMWITGWSAAINRYNQIDSSRIISNALILVFTQVQIKIKEKCPVTHFCRQTLLVFHLILAGKSILTTQATYTDLRNFSTFSFAFFILPFTDVRNFLDRK